MNRFTSLVSNPTNRAVTARSEPRAMVASPGKTSMLYGLAACKLPVGVISAVAPCRRYDGPNRNINSATTATPTR